MRRYRASHQGGSRRRDRAGGGAARDAYEGIRESGAVEVHGLADVYVQGNFNRPSSSSTGFRAFDAADGASLAWLRLTVARAPRREDGAVCRGR